MLKCRDIAHMASAQLDRRLSLNERLNFRMHLLMCRLCRRYVRQLVLLRRLAARLAEAPVAAGARLPQAARARIAARLHAALRDSDPPPA